jgi:hypothetical protein
MVKCIVVSRLNLPPYHTVVWQTRGVNLHIFTLESDGEYAGMQSMHTERAVFFDKIISFEHIIKRILVPSFNYLTTEEEIYGYFTEDNSTGHVSSDVIK